MEMNEALDIVFQAVAGYAEECLGGGLTEEYTDEYVKLNEAWELILARVEEIENVE